MSKSTGKFFLAGILGAAAGAIGGILLAPKSGKETREDLKELAAKLTKQVKSSAEETEQKVKEIFGEASKAAVDKYREIRSTVVDKIVALKSAGQDIDKEKYALIVEDVVAEYKDDLKATKNGASKMVDQLKKDWEKVKKALA
jgi:gas vesicle protein